MSRNLIIRTVVAVIFGPLIIFLCYLGGFPLMGLILLLSTIGIIEYIYNNGIKPTSLLFWVPLFFTIMIVGSSLFISPDWGYWNFMAYFLAIGVMIAIRREDPEELFNRYASLIWGVAYIGLLYPVIFYIREISDASGGDWLLFLFGTLWLSDSLAMWVGKTMGQNKLAPTVSPNKTVEGFLGGIFGGLVVALILGFWRLADIPLFQLAIVGIFISIVGQLGDLAESVWKRALRIKDSSTIIPGHGGVLDRFDSLLFAAPILYWFLRFVIYG